MSDERKPMFAECRQCGERWKVATVPIDAMKLVAALNRAICPNCGEKKQLFLCPTSGDEAVTEARNGKVLS